MVTRWKELDKYEYNLKLEEIDKLVDQGDFTEAANLADTIEWKRVRNTRTLCLISEIYEAAGRLEESKNLLVRAYRRSPVGRTVLYRLVEVTTALQQYDEAIEYYSEYVQAAPHDNNRYILKYKIYRGRGSSYDELIAILEEYLGQEYTERWAYELATLYQKAGHMQKCFAACDDLVLWFHTGKYVRKALELKKRYTTLTPKQQQIYEDCMQEAAEPEKKPVEETVLQNIEGADSEVIAATIIAQTEKEIGGVVAARREEMEREAAQNAETESAEHGPELSQTQKIAAEVRRIQQETAMKEQQTMTEAVSETEKKTEKADAIEEEIKDLQVELAKSMREIIAGVVKRTEIVEEDIPASVDSRMGNIQKVQIPEVPQQKAGQLSIDDILLSMSDKGKQLAETAVDQQPEEEPVQEPVQEEPVVHKTVTEAAAEELTDVQREALQYTSHPEKLLKKRSALPTYEEEKPEQPEAAEDLGQTRRIASKEELMEAAKKEILAEKTIRIPAEEVTRKLEEVRRAEDQELREALAAQKAEAYEESEAEAYGDTADAEEAVYEDTLDADEAVYEDAAAGDGAAYEDAAAQDGAAYEDAAAGDEAVYYEDAAAGDGAVYEDTAVGDGAYEDAEYAEEDYEGDEYEAEAYEGEEYTQEYQEEEAYGEYEEYEEEYLTIPEHLRGLFSGFTEIEGLEDQIANAIIQAESKGDDRTSRSGNILIFGAHGSGKTTLAMNLAKAIAQDKGSQVMKIAKIYAADLNRKDIAATIAKIAGGTLIIEEAGDLEPNTVEQLTTAMEFRTDGLVVILEDEQEYVHELLMRHPRFTMKFTAQIYIPVYTAEELAMFGQIYANAQDYVISEEALDVLYDKISAASAEGKPVAISDVIDMVSRAIQRSNKFLRKMSMGKKRYDENDYILLFSKDFR